MTFNKNIYENNKWQKTLSKFGHPGGQKLSDTTIKLCNWKAKSKILDLGCGNGDNAMRIQKKYNFKMSGCDISPILINLAKKSYPQGDWHLNTKAKLPFADASFDGIISECVFSAAKDNQALWQESYRLLKPQKILAIHDLYISKENDLEEPILPVTACYQNLFTWEDWRKQAENAKFKALKQKDYSEHLKNYLADLLWSGLKPEQIADLFCPKDCSLEKFKINYMLLIAQKN